MLADRAEAADGVKARGGEEGGRWEVASQMFLFLAGGNLEVLREHVSNLLRISQVSSKDGPKRLTRSCGCMTPVATPRRRSRSPSRNKHDKTRESQAPFSPRLAFPVTSDPTSRVDGSEGRDRRRRTQRVALCCDHGWPLSNVEQTQSFC